MLAFTHSNINFINCVFSDAGGDAVSKDLVHPFYVRQYERPARHSDVEESDSDTDTDSEPPPTPSPFKRKDGDTDTQQESQRKSWLSWCSLL